MKIGDVLHDYKLYDNTKKKNNDMILNENNSKEILLEEFEIKSKLRNVCLGIPTKDIDVKNIFRLLKEPICLFGEDSYDKRNRLKNILITKYDRLIIKKKIEKEDDVEEFKNILKRYYIDFSNLYPSSLSESNKINEIHDKQKLKDIHVIEDEKKVNIKTVKAEDIDILKQKFYTEGTEDLKKCRKEITIKTLPRIFLYKEMINKFQNQYSKKEYENYITSFNEHIKNVSDLYVSQLGDDRPLTMGKFSPDNSVFAISSFNSYIKIFNYRNDDYNLIKTLKNGHEEKINCIEWNYPNNYSYYSTMNYKDLSKHNLLLASCSSDKSFCIWRPFYDEYDDINGNINDDINDNMNDNINDNINENMNDNMNDNMNNNSHKVDKNNSKKNKLSSQNKNYLLCKVNAHDDKINKICFHPLNKYVLTCSDDETIKMFDLETKQELFYQEGHNTTVHSIAFNTYGNLYISGDSKGGLMLWDIRTGKNIQQMKMAHNNSIMNINFNPFLANMFCTCSTDNTIKIFDLRKFQISCNILAHNKIVTDAVFEPTHGRYIVSSSFDTFIKIWDSVNFYCTKILCNNNNKVRNVDIAPDGSFISSTSFDRTWKLYKNKEYTEDNILSHFM